MTCLYQQLSTPQKVIAYGMYRGRAGLDTACTCELDTVQVQVVSRPARPRYIPYAITFWGVTNTRTRSRLQIRRINEICMLDMRPCVSDEY